jgi:DNA-binding CsgD family transcriptional regulator
MPARAVIGRDNELATLEAFLADVERGPNALVLSGEAGIGKTILWQAGVENGRGRLDRVLTCHGVEAEASLSFAALSDLLGNVLEEVGPSLVAPRRRALEIALLLAEPGDVAPDPHAIGLAVLDVLRVLAEQGSVLVALDDAQWLDPASAGVLQIALRRLREEPIGLLVTLRKTPELGEPFELERLFPEGRLGRISVGPLSLAAVHRLLEERLGLELTRPELARVQEATAGNPFFALELGRELVRTGMRPTPGRALPMPETLQELLGGRLARLPGETLDVLLQVAALARPTVEVVAAVQGDRARVLSALEEAVGETVVELDDSRIRFSHPLLASLCYEQAPVWKRRAVHRALADAVSDLEERARHLALAAEGPDAVVASYLDDAAEQAAARGAPPAAGELAELAAELTPDDPALARQRRLHAANLYRLAGENERSVALLEQLLFEVPRGAERADVLLARAGTFTADRSTLIELCDEALAEAAGDEARLSRILAFRAWFRLLLDDGQMALADARMALEKADLVGDPELIAGAIARVGQAETWAGEITPGLLERGAEIEERLKLVLDYQSSPSFSLLRFRLRLGEIERSRAKLEEFERKAVARGDEGTRFLILQSLSYIEWLAGRWQRALDHAVAGQELGEQSQFSMTETWAGRIRALVETDLGLVEEARAHAKEGLASARALSDEIFIVLTLGVLGRLELALGNIEEAGEYLRELPERLLAGGMNDPSQPVWADAIETLVALGDLDRAGAYLEPYELNATRLGSPIAATGAARCRGLLSAGEGSLAAATASFDASLSYAAPYPLEQARTLLCLGTVRRQAQEKKAAREALEQALAIFDELGARLWADKARAELARISGRAPASEELTETERRVAELAGLGRTNKQIAAELFMGVSTVESHLSHVYGKLGVRRAGLAARLDAPQGAPAKAGGEPVQT